MAIPLIKKAVRQRIFLKLVVGGPSGGGKTYGAIGVAKGLAPTGKIGVIDTENRSASYYASKWDFDVIELEAPFTTQKYLEALNAFIQGGYEVVVIDSLTHEWAASGGILDQKASKDARGGNSFANWNEMKQLHNKFVEVLLQSQIHVVCTLRSKMEYALEQDEKGKSTVRKVGLAPISSDGMEYEFGVMFDVDRNSHLAVASKDRTGLFEGRNMNLDETIGQELRTWLESGAEMAPARPTQAPAPAANPAASTASPAPTAPSKPATPAAAAPQAPPTPRRRTAPVAAAAPTAAPDFSTHPDWPDFVEAMADLAQVTMGMPDMTRSKLVQQFDAEGPASLEALVAEIASIRSIMQPETAAPKTAGAVLAQLPPLAKLPISQEASDFADAVAEGPGSPEPEPDTDEAAGGISADQYTALNNYIKAYGLNRDSLRTYMGKLNGLLPGANGPTLARMTSQAFTKLREDLTNTKPAPGGKTWSQVRIERINATPSTPYKPAQAAS